MATELKEHLWGKYKKLTASIRNWDYDVPPLPGFPLIVEGDEARAQKVTLLKSWLVSAWVWNPRAVPLRGHCSCPMHTPSLLAE